MSDVLLLHLGQSGLEECANGLTPGIANFPLQATEDAGKSVMSWGKLAHGTIHLYSLYGDGGPAGRLASEQGSDAAGTAATSSGRLSPRGLAGRFTQMLQNLLLNRCPTPAKVWDLEAAVLRLGWSSSSVDDVQPQDEVSA